MIDIYTYYNFPCFIKQKFLTYILFNDKIYVKIVYNKNIDKCENINFAKYIKKDEGRYEKNILRAILIALLITQMWIIFGFSGQNGDESGSISRKITEAVTKNISSIQNLEKEEKERV